ncbi:MAG: molybdopterin-dependent oxidoreductase [Firmicutes bacterium]|nr:molybdopterin-dependent oxidoreductase [Bacillota bacterium]
MELDSRDSHDRGEAQTAPAPIRMIQTACAHDCGGKCPLLVEVRVGRAVRIGVPRDLYRRYPFSACHRGLSYLKRLYHPERLLRPLVRSGPRGAGEFRAAGWEEALSLVAGGLAAVKDRHGPAAILNLCRTGSLGALLHDTRRLGSRFLNLFGGCTEPRGSYSYSAAEQASLVTYGVSRTASDRSDLEHSRLIVLWGWNPLEILSGSTTKHYLKRARRRGVPIVCIDPRRNASAAFASRWIPIRPGTDVALASAVGHELIRHGWIDSDFIDRHTVGFEEYRDYVLGAEDGIPRDPDWAALVTGIPAAAIRELAREIGTIRPAAIVSGWGPQRGGQGEQFTRAVAVLTALTGNVGRRGGAAAGTNLGFGPSSDAGLPIPPNPCGSWVRTTAWADAVLRGEKGGYPSDLKAAFIVGGNPLNQQGDVRKAVQAFQSLDLVVVLEQFMTPTARYADVILPACTWMEREDILIPLGGNGNYVLRQGRAVEPLPGSLPDLEILSRLAGLLGFGADFNPYGSEPRCGEEAWLREIGGRLGLEGADYVDFRREGIRFFPEQPELAFEEQIAGRKPFPTPSGRIEIRSEKLARLDNPLVPAIPRYLPFPEGPEDPLRARYPLQLLSPHPRWRINSTLDNILKGDRRVWLNPADAAGRGIADGDAVRVHNHRGMVRTRARVTRDVVPGAVCLDAGAWFDLDDAAGEDSGGNPNLLTSDRGTPHFQSPTLQSALVEVEKAF